VVPDRGKPIMATRSVNCVDDCEINVAPDGDDQRRTSYQIDLRKPTRREVDTSEEDK
jgi:hypothetical protein